jgi:hypothetical protein
MTERMQLQSAGFLKRLAEASQEWRHLPLGRLVERLEGGEDLCDLAREFGLLADAAEEEHLRRDWYGGASSWWPEHDVTDIVRRAYVDALRMVQERGVPVAAYWIEGASELRVELLPSRNQITMLFLTPHRKPILDALALQPIADPSRPPFPPPTPGRPGGPDEQKHGDRPTFSLQPPTPPRAPAPPGTKPPPLSGPR